MNNAVEREALYYLRLPEEALLALIGQTYKIAAMGDFPSPSERGREWFEYHEAQLYGRLCLEERLCARLTDSGFSDEVTLLLSIADIICSITVGIPPFVVSALLIKKGITAFCHCGKDMDITRRRRIISRSAIWYNNLSHDIGRETALGDEAQVDSIRNWESQRHLAFKIISFLYQDQFCELLKAYDVPVPVSG